MATNLGQAASDAKGHGYALLGDMYTVYSISEVDADDFVRDARAVIDVLAKVEALTQG